jgi:uncharacterized membrane protein YeaQ/YmgE (transglycosylase-associated protein family)
VWFGALLLGWIAGDVIESDPVVQPWLHRLLGGTIARHLDAASAFIGVPPDEAVGYLASILGAAIVLIAGSIWRRRKLAHTEQAAMSSDGTGRRE